MDLSQKKLSLLIVDDHKLFCQAMRNNFIQNNIIREVEIASDGVEAVSIMREYSFDIIFMDYKMKHMNGDEATRRIIELYPGVKIIAISMLDDKETIAKMMDAGCQGYVLKNSDIDTLNEAINKVCEGHKFLDPLISDSTLLT